MKEDPFGSPIIPPTRGHETLRASLYFDSQRCFDWYQNKLSIAQENEGRMNLRNAENYTIGLDLGTNSVGWAVVDEEGKLYHIKGQPSWGTRLFPDADPAASTRLKRGQRRRYERRRQRLDKLQEFFFEEIDRVDPEFFVRLRQSRLLPEDRREDIKEYRWPLFNGSNFTEAAYYNTFPTIFHLRKHLMESTKKEDIRLVYLALHNIVKYRGNFLHEDEGTSLTAANANATQSAQTLAEAVQDYFVTMWGDEAAVDLDVRQIEEALDSKSMRRADRADAIKSALNVSDKEDKKRCKEISRACVGYKVDFSDIFEGVEKGEGTKFSLGDEGKPDEFLESLCPDDACAVFEAIQGAYSAFVLSGILRGAKSISEAMIRSYETHAHDLDLLKGLFKDYLGKKAYRSFFRGELDERGNYDINKLEPGTYTSYIEGEKKANKLGTSYEDLIKSINKQFEANPVIKSDPRYAEIAMRLDAGEGNSFLSKQRTRENGAIPYQLHLEEMDKIIYAQGKFYPFLLENRDAIEKLVSSRIPYYVGPLNFGPDPAGSYSNNPIDSTRKFAWAKRKPGTEGIKAYPWNVDDVVDSDETAERFIRRMTGTCTYLYGEPVLPRRSLLYEEYCVLNELNGARWSSKGGRAHRFDHVDKAKIVNDLFKNRNSPNVTYKMVQEWLKWNAIDAVNPEVSGGQGETGFESKLSTYHDFCKVFGTENLDDTPLTFDELEEIVLWNTVFEDRAIFKRKLRSKFGSDGDNKLTDEQINKLVAKRYTGWGRLSKKLLTGIRVPASVPSGSVSIMDVLREGNPFSHPDQMVLMEVLADKDLCFQAKIDEINKEHFANENISIEDMQGSPANRRAVNQAMKILDEISRITGKAPARICIEVTRDDDMSKKGSRTKKRYTQLKEALKAFKADAELLSDLDEKQRELGDDRLLLYFEQQGKCMYSGEPLDISRLSDYQIDHIIPQAYVKDDSLSNRALVKSTYNQRKRDSLLLDDEIIDKRCAWWRALCDAKAISKKKFERLTCKSLSERQVNGFINRQLVETSQIVKFVRQMCEQKYKSAKVVSIRANTSHGVRENLGLVKCRELNNFHHAHDAFIACQAADFIGRCYPDWENGIKLAYIQKSIKDMTQGSRPGTALGRSGFIADSLTNRCHINYETGEIVWDNADRCNYIRKALGYKSCFISRMQIEGTGAFWKETLISPRDSSHNVDSLAPSKEDLPARKYGGFEKPENAYALIYSIAKGDGEIEILFRNILIYQAYKVADEESLIDYLAKVHKLADASGVKILKKICLYQLIELNGSRYYLGGKTGNRRELLLATEAVLSQDLMKQIYALFHLENGSSPLDYHRLYKSLSKALDIISNDLSGILALDRKVEAFESLHEDDKQSILKNLVKRISGETRDVDLRLVGGSKQAGKYAKTIEKELKNIVWIDQSVTGIFESRTTFEDLCRGL